MAFLGVLKLFPVSVLPLPCFCFVSTLLRNLQRQSLPAWYLRCSPVDLSDLNFCSSTWVLYPSHPALLVSLQQAGHFPILSYFPFLECLLPSSSFLHSFPTFKVLITPSGVVSPISNAEIIYIHSFIHSYCLLPSRHMGWT